MALRPTAAALVCAFLLAAPAASAAAPRVTEFERAVPGSTVTVAPGRSFNTVGFSWRGSGKPRVSIQSEGPRGWSDWVSPQTSGIDGPDPTSSVDPDAASSSEPVWTGTAKRIRVRVSGARVQDLKARFIRVSGTRTLHAARAAAGEAPAIVPRSQWDPGNRCKPRTKPSYGEVQGTVVHHTESTNSYSQSEAAAVVLGICRYHRNTRKWHDIGYNLLIDRFGTVFEGRAGGVERAVVGAHAQGYNGQTSGISLIGGFMSTAPSQAALDSLKKTLKWKLDLAGITRNERVPLISTGGGANRYKYGRLVFVRPVSGHRDLDYTNCPGNVLYGRINQIQDFLTGPARTATRVGIKLRRVPLGGPSPTAQAVQASGRLLAGSRKISGHTVSLEYYTAGGWLPLASAQTDPEGIWRAQVVPRGRYYMRASFAGTEELRAVRSRWYYSPKLRR